MRFYKTSRSSRILQTLILTLLVASTSMVLVHDHRWRWSFCFVLVMAAGQVHSLWTNYWEITPDGKLLARTYGFNLRYETSSVLYAGPVREMVGYPVSKKDIELEFKGSQKKRYVRVADRSEFLEWLRSVSPQAQVIRL
ncbi:hypothetical protein AciX8_1277 [Granulicella mallensis MP5ACTX8]|uniref:PH domain-containing protein n=1 Tax=Granulicella mallensis (strain ATCC BAA-1857 / DSM 23137 / MP5ACTX8) TaxID=682795 RepID=G8NY32_GRAMM|nr:hypothetical protein AciX8_1277 [Granulicella mallensis MP5ACTX8]